MSLSLGEQPIILTVVEAVPPTHIQRVVADLPNNYLLKYAALTDTRTRQRQRQRALALRCFSELTQYNTNALQVCFVPFKLCSELGAPGILPHLVCAFADASWSSNDARVC
jgi:hypothetical protein